MCETKSKKKRTRKAKMENENKATVAGESLNLLSARFGSRYDSKMPEHEEMMMMCFLEIRDKQQIRDNRYHKGFYVQTKRDR